MEKRERDDGPAGLGVSGAERTRDIDLADILDAIRKDASALETAEHAQHTSAAPARGAAAIVRPSRIARIPTVAASLHVRTDAAERARRLEEERRRRSSGGKAPADDEATVSFVVRESPQG